MGWLEDLDSEVVDDTPSVEVNAEIVETQSGTVVNVEKKDVERPSSKQFWTGEKAPCYVGFECGLTIVTGQYENAQPKVSIKIPTDLENVEEAYKFCEEFVDQRLSALKNQVQESLDGPS